MVSMNPLHRQVLSFRLARVIGAAAGSGVTAASPAGATTPLANQRHPSGNADLQPRRSCSVGFLQGKFGCSAMHHQPPLGQRSKPALEQPLGLNERGDAEDALRGRVVRSAMVFVSKSRRLVVHLAPVMLFGVLPVSVSYTLTGRTRSSAWRRALSCSTFAVRISGKP